LGHPKRNGGKKEEKKEMGQGKAKRQPLDSLIKRCGKDNFKILQIKKTPVKKLIGDYLAAKKVKSCISILDLAQDIENSRHISRTGQDSYNYVRTRIYEFLFIPQCQKVICTNDCDKTPNIAKEMSYYTINSKRRINKRPLDSNKILMNDTFIPQGDDWTGMKINPALRKQINYYYPSKFQEEQTLHDQNVKIVEFDNYVEKKHLFGTKQNETVFCSLEFMFKNGIRSKISKGSASEISEGEIQIEYFIQKEMKKNRNITCIAVTNDIDMIPITLINAHHRMTNGVFDNKVFIACKTKNKKHGKHFTMIDVNMLCKNIFAYHNNDPLALIKEALLIVLGGCDYNDKPFSGIGYKYISEAFLNDSSFLGMMEVNTKLGDQTVKCQTIEIDPAKYLEFARDVYRRKKRTFEQRDDLHVIPRQIMFNLLWYFNTVHIRLNHGCVPVFDPMHVDGSGKSVWGYKFDKVKGAPLSLVCVSANNVSINYFI